MLELRRMMTHAIGGSRRHIARLSVGGLASVFALLVTGCEVTPLMGFGGPDASDGSGGTSCTVSGTAYEDGATGIKSTDGCNTCSCVRGELACTLLGCPDPGQVCGGLLGLGCPRGTYCNYPSSARCGAADATGFCGPIPDGCTLEVVSVCGCDGKTYGNACGAAMMGVSVMHEGACTPASGACVVGGVTYADGSGNIPATDGCNICSCGNGVLRCSLRACPAPKACGARAGNTCTASEYCAYTEGSYCGAADAEATCKPRPDICITLYAPVCGCDGRTYSNACAASAAGSGVLNSGPCAGTGRSCVVGGVTYPDGSGNIPATDGCNVCGCSDGVLGCTKKACTIPKQCGGFAGFICDPTEYCAYVEGDFCGAADASSTCKKRPDGCTTDVNPVCGCDGKTYSNACAAAAAGVGYSSKGGCPR